MPFCVRSVAEKDLNAVYELSAHLDSFNLPHDRVALKELIGNSDLAFQDATRPRELNTYIFVLEDLDAKKIIGCSMIFAKHGTPDKPHTYLQIFKKSHADESNQIKIDHQMLRFEYDTDGPTEIGGLILHPDYRKSPHGLGKLLSYSRFLYMATDLKRFEKQVIAELLPPFNESGSSELWEAFGRRFTGLSYQEADRLSRTDRNFIRNLFPQEDIYTCLFSKKAQDVIGKTHTSSSPVKHMLEKIGFSDLNAVDPFDGGPHFGAKTDQITLIKRAREMSWHKSESKQLQQSALIGFYDAHRFVVIPAMIQKQDDAIEIDQTSMPSFESYTLPKSVWVITPL